MLIERDLIPFQEALTNNNNNKQQDEDAKYKIMLLVDS